jgi:hypothetical protein
MNGGFTYGITIWCATCGNWETLDAPSQWSQKRAGVAFRKKGWSVSAKQSICPNCRKADAEANGKSVE